MAIEEEKAMTGTRGDYRDEIRVRMLNGDDEAIVERLAQLDSARAPAAPLLGAFGRGGLLAALSLREGNVIANPFVRTAELREVLECRAAHLRNRPKGRLRRLVGRLSRRAQPASPPGAAGRLLELSPRRPL
jgi:hypothetical protein